jgi:hypothetical protein
MHTNAPRCLSQSAERELCLRREEPQRALEAWRDARQDDACVALEAFSAAVNQWLDAGRVSVALLIKLCMLQTCQ